MTAKEFEIKRRDLSKYRTCLRKQDRHDFHLTMREFGFENDWDLIEDGKIIARCSDKKRLLKFARRL